MARISFEKKICKSIWLNETCQTANCDRAHPPRCNDPDCLIIDQGLPRWKTLQCRSWHGRPKVKKNFKFDSNSSKHHGRVNSKANKTPSPVNWGSSAFSSRAKIPVWQEFDSYQNSWFKSGPSLTPQFVRSAGHPLNNISGNELAASWSTPLPMGGSPFRGNQNFLQTVRRAMCIVQLNPYA